MSKTIRFYKSSLAVRLVIICLFIVFCDSLSSYERSSYKNNALKIQVTDIEGNPLSDVFLLINNKVITSTEDGLIEMKDIPDFESVTLYRTGYKQIDISRSDLLASRNITMERRHFYIPGLIIRSEYEHLADRSIILISPEMRNQTLPEVLNRYMNISGTPLAGERQTASLGGHHPRHLVVMLDGIPLNRMGSPVDISTVSLDNIESVEIIRGGSSSIAGSGAVSGIVNLRTRQSSNFNEYSVNQSIGSYGYNKTALQVSQNVNRFWFDFSADKGSTKNNYYYKDRNGEMVRREFNDKAFHNFYLKTIYRNLQNMIIHKIDYHGFNNKLPGPVNYLLLYQDARLKGFNLNNDIRAIIYYNHYSLETKLYYLLSETKYDNTRTPHPFFRIVGEHYSNKQGASFTAAYKPASDNFFNTKISAQYDREDFKYDEPTNTNNSIPNIFNENYSLRNETSLNLPVYRKGTILGLIKNSNRGLNKVANWLHDASIRYDKTKLWQNNYSWRYFTSFDLYNPDLMIGYAAANSYNLPSFYDLYWKGDSQASGNPDLMPENSFSTQIFGELRSYLFTLSTSYEISQVDNLIYWFRSVTGWKPDNIASAKIAHLKYTLDLYPFDFCTLSMSYTQTEALNKTLRDDGSPADFYNKKLPYKPQDNFYGEIKSSFDMSNSDSSPHQSSPSIITFKLRHSYTGKQWTTLDQLIDPLPSYHITDIDIGWRRLLGQIDFYISLSLKNIFDTEYEIYAYTPKPGFNWVLNFNLSHTN